MMRHPGEAWLTTVVIFALMCINNPSVLVNCLDSVSDHESPTGDGTVNAMKAGPTEEPKTRPCNSCELEKCRRHCKGTCRPCQYHFCHVDEGEYSCKCLRNPPAVTTSSPPLGEEDEAEGEGGRKRRSRRVPRALRVPRYVPPRRGKRIRNCHRP